jgi:hypothetical protein
MAAQRAAAGLDPDAAAQAMRARVAATATDIRAIVRTLPQTKELPAADGEASGVSPAPAPTPGRLREEVRPAWGEPLDEAAPEMRSLAPVGEADPRPAALPAARLGAEDGKRSGPSGVSSLDGAEVVALRSRLVRLQDALLALCRSPDVTAGDPAADFATESAEP